MAMLIACACPPVGLASLGRSVCSSPSRGGKSSVISRFQLPRASAVAGNLQKKEKKNFYKNDSAASLGFIGSSVAGDRVLSLQLDVLRPESSAGGALGSMCSLPASVETLRWVLVAAATTLLFVKNAAIPKQFLVPLLALELPREAFSWLRGEYGLWTAFVALLVKLFYQIPGELQLPLYTLLLVISAPAQILKYRGTTPAALASLVLAVYLGVEHYRSLGNINDAFKSDKLLPTIAILALVIVPILFFVNSVYV